MWTYVSGYTDDLSHPELNCPCAATPGPDPPAFVGDHYYCESGATGQVGNEYFTADILWDGYGCHHANNNCCTNADMPWFFQQFSRSVNDIVAARICHSAFGHGITLMKGTKLYIQ